MIKRLDLRVAGDVAKSYLIGDGASFIGAPKHIKEQEGIWDYLYYSSQNFDGNAIAIPTIRPLSYAMEDFCFSPNLTIEERKEKIIQSWELKGYEVDILRWEEVIDWDEPLTNEEFNRRAQKRIKQIKEAKDE